MDDKKEYLGKNALAHLKLLIKEDLNNKVDKDGNKVLSSNDFTDDLKTKLENAPTQEDIPSLEGYAKENKIPDVSNFQTSEQVEEAITSKGYATESFVTEKGYQTADDVDKKINSKISTVMDYKGEVNTYEELPKEEVKKGDVYNVKTADETHGVKAGDNVAWNGTDWDVLAGTFDTTGLVKTSDLEEITNPEIDEIWQS